MELKVSIRSSDEKSARQDATILKDTIEHYTIPNTKVVQLVSTLPPDAAGTSLLESIITIVVGQNVIGKLLDIIKIWIETHHKKLEKKQTEIEIEYPAKDGKTQKIVLKDVNNAKSVLKELENLIAESDVK